MSRCRSEQQMDEDEDGMQVELKEIQQGLGMTYADIANEEQIASDNLNLEEGEMGSKNLKRNRDKSFVLEGVQKKKKLLLEGSGRPVRERKLVKRLIDTLGADSEKIQIVKGRGTPLMDIPNVVYKLSKMENFDTLKLLHTVLFGRVKGADIQYNVSNFSGFVWRENEEKQRLKVREKLYKCGVEKLVQLCDVLDIPVSDLHEDDIVGKLVQFLDAPHPTSSSLLAVKEKFDIINQFEREAHLQIAFSWMNPGKFLLNWKQEISPLPNVLFQGMKPHCIVYTLFVMLQSMIKIEWHNNGLPNPPPMLPFQHLDDIITDFMGEYGVDDYKNLERVLKEIQQNGVALEASYRGFYPDNFKPTKKFRFNHTSLSGLESDVTILSDLIGQGPFFIDMEFVGSIPTPRFEKQYPFKGLSKSAKIEASKLIEAHAVAGHSLTFALDSTRRRRFLIYQNSYGDGWGIGGHAAIEDRQIRNMFKFERDVSLSEWKRMVEQGIPFPDEEVTRQQVHEVVCGILKMR